MQGFRIANLMIQSLYLVFHLLFILFLYHKRQATPVWIWFFRFSVALWIWVSGRFMETIVYLFFPAALVPGRRQYGSPQLRTAIRL